MTREEDECDVNHQADRRDHGCLGGIILNRVDQVVRQVRQHCVEADGVQHAGAEADQDDAGVLLEQRTERSLDLGALLLGKIALHLGIHGRVAEVLSHVVGHQTQRTGQQERDTPTPIHNERGIMAADRIHNGCEHRTAQQARSRGGRNDGAVQTALVDGRVLCQKRCSTGIFARSREALHHAQRKQQHRGEQADHSVGGQAADQERSTAHQQDRSGEGPFTTLFIAHVAPEHCADRTHEEREREDGERLEKCDRRVIGRHEDQCDNRCEVRITRVIEPFNKVTQE